MKLEKQSKFTFTPRDNEDVGGWQEAPDHWNEPDNYGDLI